MPSLQDRFQEKGWYLSPGPLGTRVDPLPTVIMQNLEEYDYVTVAQAILSHRGTRCIQPSEPSWERWKARWEQDSRSIEIDMCPGMPHYESSTTGEPIWSGSELVCDCLARDLAELLRTVRDHCPGVWLCDGGALSEGGSALYTARSFSATWEETGLCPAVVVEIALGGVPLARHHELEMLAVSRGWGCKFSGEEVLIDLYASSNEQVRRAKADLKKLCAKSGWSFRSLKESNDGNHPRPQD